MIDEMTGPGGWGVLERITAGGGTRPVAVADAGYGDNTTFRLELTDRGWRYVLAVKGTTSAYAGDAEPVTPARRGGPGRPPRPAYPGPPANLRQLAIAHADNVRPVTWRQGTKAAKSPCAGMTLYQVLHELQIVLAVILSACPLCRQPLTLDRLAAALAGT
jgi:hypothetical protein